MRTLFSVERSPVLLNNKGMKLTLRIVPAVAADVPLIHSFIRELAEYEKLQDFVTTNEERIRETFFGPDPSAQAVFAYGQAEPMGFAVFFFTYSTFSGRPSLYLEDIYVKREARGKGVGRELLRYLARLAKSRGCQRMDWAVLDWNEAAISFYKKIGAAPISGWTVYRLEGKAFDHLAANDFQTNDKIT